MFLKPTNYDISPTMKFSSLAIFLAAAGTAGAFTIGVQPASYGVRSRPASPSAFSLEESSTALHGRRRKGAKRRTFGKVKLNSDTTSGSAKDISESEVRALFSLWNNALATGDSRIVAKRYAKESILLPTVSDTPRTDFASIKDYFDAFLLKQPSGKILEGDIRIGDGWAQVSYFL